MFTFDKEKPSKFVATACTKIVPSHESDPMIWTPDLKEFYTRRVFIVCSLNSRGRRSFRFYPLQKRNDRPPPAFCIVDKKNKWLSHTGTHRVFMHENFEIIRPLPAVIAKAKYSIKKKDIEYIPINLLTLVKHCYFQDLIDDEFIEKAERQFEKISSIIARAESTDSEGELEACIDRLFVLCNKILNEIEERVEI